MQIFQKTKSQPNNSINNDARRPSVMQWGFAVSVFMIVIFVMVVNFCVISRNNAYYEIRSQLITASEKCAADVAFELDKMHSAASAVAAIMEDKDKCSNKDIAWYAQRLQRAQNDAYMVVIADNEGVGYTSGVKRVDISEMDYFKASRESNYYITDDDGIIHNRAYVMNVPYYQDNARVGTIYMFMSAEGIAEMIPTGAYDLAGAFVVCGSDGELLSSTGAKTVFLENGKFLDNLEKAAFSDEETNADRIIEKRSQVYLYSGIQRGNQNLRKCSSGH